MGAMGLIREFYGVHAKRGGRVRFMGQLGTITSAMPGEMHLRLRMDYDPSRTIIVHPTWQMEYLDKEQR